MVKCACCVDRQKVWQWCKKVFNRRTRRKHYYPYGREAREIRERYGSRRSQLELTTVPKEYLPYVERMSPVWIVEGRD